LAGAGPRRVSEERRDDLLLWAGAFAVRLAAAAALGALIGYVDDGRYDDGAYIQMARSFLGRDPIIFLTHPPLYALTLAPFLAIPGGVTAARVAQLLLGAAMAPLTRRLARALGLGGSAALAAGVLVALDPMLIFFSVRLMTETLFCFLVLAFFQIWIGAWRGGRLRDAAFAGLVGGLASLARGSFLPFGGVLAVVAYLGRKRQPRWLALTAVCGLAWAATIAPWTARNYVRIHRFVPISAQGGWSLYEGLTVDLDEIARRPVEMGREGVALGLSGPLAVDAYFAAKAKAWIKANPGGFVRLCLLKAAKFWRPFPYPPHTRAARWAIGLFASALYLLAGLALARGSLRDPDYLFLLGWALLLTALHSVFASAFRYRLPLEPFLAVAAAAGLFPGRADSGQKS
jgi:4-amino-4-deoxy-L-arabinose transferase-like glycosyltransferase